MLTDGINSSVKFLGLTLLAAAQSELLRTQIAASNDALGEQHLDLVFSRFLSNSSQAGILTNNGVQSANMVNRS